jgi:hypothetical protein
MKKSRLLGAVCASMFTFATATSHAVLQSRLGGLAYYDTDANLTWLADVNAVAGSAYDTHIPGSGLMTWAVASTWAAGLGVDGVTGWRLPTTLQPDSGCDSQFDPGGGLAIQGYHYDCTASEMGNLFYNVLGGTARDSITTNHNDNYDLFSNIQSSYYWSSTDYAPDTDSAWYFVFDGGDQWNLGKGANTYAWAVHSGDVGAVPIPPALCLFGSGLLGLIGLARKKAA